MTRPLVTIRPGTYRAAVLQRPNGDSRQGPWTREGMKPGPIFSLLHKDERLAYVIRCTLPPTIPFDTSRDYTSWTPDPTAGSTAPPVND